MKNVKKRLLFFLFVVVSFPAAQGFFSFYESGTLQGVFSSAANPVFNWSTWWDGTYQYKKSCYLNDSTGCRIDLVRLNNQLDFSLFKKTHVDGVYVGKDDYLFADSYMCEYKGVNTLPKAAFNEDIREMKMLQDTLARLGKTFIFAFAPSQAWYFSDKFPKDFAEVNTMKTPDYLSVKQTCDSFNINTIDFNAWFLAMKDTSRELLFSRKGLHWTVYGSALTLDSLIRYIEKARQVKMPEMQWQGVSYSNDPQQTDGDLLNALNLIFPLPADRFAYPQITFSPDSNLTKPRALYIGDSFTWNWIYHGLLDKTGTNSEFWYYFKERWTAEALAGREKMVQVSDYDWLGAMLKSEVIVLLLNTANFEQINREEFFVKSAYHHFYPRGK